MKILLVISIFLILNFNLPFVFDQDYYRSNSIGMVFEKIPSFRIDDFPWVIKLFKTGSLETRVVYYKGEENKRLEYVSEGNTLELSEYVSNKLVKTEKIIDGLVIKEELYKDEEIYGKYTYEWDGHVLQKIIYIENDIHIYDDIFIVENNGQLKQIRRIYEQGQSRISEFGYSDKGINTEWHGTEKEASLYRYEDGKVVQIENWLDGTLIRKKIITPADFGSLVIESDLLTGVVIESKYDMEDKLLSEETKDGNTIQKYTYLYESDLLIEKKIASRGIRENHFFYYNADNSLRYKEIFNDGMLTKEIFYKSGKKEIEKVYRDNYLLLMVFYKDGEKIREERMQ